jgi:hypothetical protein
MDHIEEEKTPYDLANIHVDAIVYRGRNNDMYRPNINIDSKNDP